MNVSEFTTYILHDEYHLQHLKIKKKKIYGTTTRDEKNYL